MAGVLYALKDVMSPITIYTTAWCGLCERAKAFLEARGLAYDEVRVDEEPGFRDRLLALTGRATVPQIVVGEEPIGGYSELRALDRDGRLDELLAA
jgi:glutaredoxin 3